MPGMDGTGPMGLGPMTGFGRGICADANDVRRTWGCRRGFGRGRGMGFCRIMPEITKEELISRKALLEKHLNMLQQQIEKL